MSRARRHFEALFAATTHDMLGTRYRDGIANAMRDRLLARVWPALPAEVRQRFYPVVAIVSEGPGEFSFQVAAWDRQRGVVPLGTLLDHVDRAPTRLDHVN